MDMLSKLEEQKALVSKKEKLVDMVMNFESKKTNNRARAFGMKAMKQLQDDEENSGSGSGYNAGSGDNSGYDFSGSGWDWLNMFFQERKGASETNAKELMSALKKLAQN